MGSIRVLHVDDDPTFGDLAAECLEREDEAFEVHTETSAGDALDHLVDGEVDCVVSDYDMPGTDGVEFLERLREHDLDLPFVLFTGKGSESVASEAFSAGATDYLQKEGGSDQFTVLANRVRNYVAEYRAQSRRRAELAAFGAAHDGIAILDDDGRFTFVNEAYADLYGYDPAEMVGEAWELVYPEDEVAFARETVLPAAAVEGEWQGQTTGLRADGTTFPEDHVVARTEGGDLVCAVRDASGSGTDGDGTGGGSGGDVAGGGESDGDGNGGGDGADGGGSSDERFRRYETIVDSLNDPVYALDDEGRFTDVNDAFCEFVGYDRETVVGAGPSLIKDEEAVETAERNLARLLSEEGPDSRTFEIDIQPAEGDPIPCEDHMGVLWGDDGSFEGSVGTLRDVSERVENRRRLREEKRLLDRSIDALSDIYYFLDTDGRIQRWNSSLEAVTGYDGAELEGRDAMEFFEGEDRERITGAVAEAIEAGSARVKADLVTNSGGRIPYEFTGARLDDDSGEIRGVIGVGRDVTERRAYERRLERKNERLEEFASVVSHDLRNPLNVAQGRIRMLRENVAQDGIEDVAAVERSLDRMEALIGDLLTLAREGEGVDETEPVDLGDLFEGCWQTVDPDAAGATLRVETTATVEADASRLQQLAENLLSNAVEHGSTSPPSTSSREDAVEHGSTSPDSSSTRQDAVEHGSTSPQSQTPEDAVDHGGTNVTVTVGDLDDRPGFFIADDGPGVPPGQRERVFESGHSTTRRGTGFGLSIVETVAEAHGWTVDLVESETGGARFEFGTADAE